MTNNKHPMEPPAPALHLQDLPPLRLLLGSIRNSLAIWPSYAFDVPFARNTVFGIKTVLVNDPAGVRHVMATNAANYVRPPMMPRIMRPVVGHGLFLAKGEAWRRQRRLLSSSFTPGSINTLLPHFAAAADDLVRELDGESSADLSDAYQRAALNAVLRALLSLPDAIEREHLGALVRQYVSGPGRPQIWDGFARSETSFSFALGRRRAFQKKWFAAIDDVVSSRRTNPHSEGDQDLLDLLISARDPETSEQLGAEEIRDQCATMIFAGYETTARLLFWATYLLTLDPAEQGRVREEIATFPPENISTLEDLQHWPRLRLVLLEALRLYPPVPLLVREPIEDDIIMGEPIKRGVQVYIAPWVMHRHRAHWQHPTAFMPSRFAGQTSPWTSSDAYLPFGAGPRICIGATFAMAEAQIILATMLSRFAISTTCPNPVMPVGRLTIQPSHSPAFQLQR